MDHSASNQPVIEVFLPTYRTEPAENEKFYPSEAKKIAEKVVEADLGNQTYDEEDAKVWSVEIGNKIREAMKAEMNIPRYKVVIQVTIGQMCDQGIRVASRCLWDLSTDNYSAVNYTNRTTEISCRANHRRRLGRSKEGVITSSSSIADTIIYEDLTMLPLDR